MFASVDKKGNKTIRLSRYEQGVLAANNIQFIKVQQMREQHLPSEEIVEAEIKLAGMRRQFDKLIS